MSFLSNSSNRRGRYDAAWRAKFGWSKAGAGIPSLAIGQIATL